MRKSRAAYPGSARSIRSRNAAISSSRVRFSMKYSSTSAVALNGDRVFMGFLDQRPLVLQRPEDIDGADDEAAIDFVGVERDADGPQHHDGQPSAQVLAEFVQAAQHARRMILLIEVPRQLRRVDRELQRLKEADDATPVG